jgi:hypothetical protein
VKVSVKMPTSAFGMREIDQSEDMLRRTYKDLYYVTPQNLKHQLSNSFILKMCSSARWQFNTVKELYTWARQERSLRTAMLICFTPGDELAKESTHFKHQSILYQLDELKSNYKDIFTLCYSDKQPPAMKFERYIKVMDEVSGLLKWAQDGVNRADTKHKDVRGKDGRREEAEFWFKAKTLGIDVIEKVQNIQRFLKKIEAGFGDSSSQKQKSAIRSRQKTEKRKVRTQLKAEGGQPKMYKKPRKERISIADLLKKNMPKQTCSSWKCSMFDSRHSSHLYQHC